MSGVKSATVRKNLGKVVSTVNAGITECERAAAEACEIGRSECVRSETRAKSVHDGVRRTLPNDVVDFLRGETGRWESSVRQHDEMFKSATGLVAAADEKEREFKVRKQACEGQISQIGGSVRRIQNALRGKEWYCEAENAEAYALRRQAEQVLEKMRRDVSLGRQAQDLRRQGVSRFSESESLARDAEREYDRLVNLAGERKERQRIKEENERKAKNLEGDLVSLRRAIESKNFAKFGDAVYTSADRRELDDVLRLIENGRYETAMPRAEALRGRLAQAASAIDAAQRVWEAGKLAAERTLADAREEASKVDREHLCRYSGTSESEIDSLFSEIDAAAGDIRAEEFDAAKKKAAAAVENLRAIKERTDANFRMANERDEMAQAIMQAFYDANFDTPEYYLQDDSDSLSDLCVVAAAPGGVGDMKLRIDLSGETKFEVCNIPEGHEQLCIDQIRSLQRNLAESDIRFDMKDWGRAKDQGKVHVDVGSRSRTTVQTIQRQG